MSARSVFLMLMWAVPSMAMALGPHEILVLVNSRSPDSVTVAREFVKLRKVPAVNVVRLELPASFTGPAPAAAMSDSDFTGFIWTPAVRAMRKRGIAEHILAWVYSTDFPVMIETHPPISIQGITFMRNRPVDSEQAQNGTYTSPFFTGPSAPGGTVYFPQTFDVYRRWLGNDMPLPSMMLGYTGARGNSIKTVLQSLENGALSDGVAPTGTIYLVKSDDVRSRCRDWQFNDARRELRNLHVNVVVTNLFPAGKQDIMGLLMGAPSVDPEQNNRYLPGCMAEHLTSQAAEFSAANQTKLNAWIKAGATASAGTVTEPLAIWTKFPGARFFVHYVSGCSMIESFFQSIRCPLQILLVGDPLAQPWAPGAELVMRGITNENVSGIVSLRAEVSAEPGNHYSKFAFLLDGRPVLTAARDKDEPANSLKLDTTKFEDGPHTLRAIAYRTGLVRTQVFVEKEFCAQNGPAGEMSISAPYSAADSPNAYRSSDKKPEARK